jgi:hypothetical protein
VPEIGPRELLRPPPHRGPLIAAGAVTLAVGIALVEVRLRDAYPLGLHVALLVGAGGLIFWLGAQAPTEDGVPPAYQSVLLLTGVPLLYAGFLTAADSLAPGALLWTSALIAVIALWPALERASAVSLLIAAIGSGLTLLAAWAWLFGESATWTRALMALYAGGLVLASLALRGPAPRHAEVLVDAAGVAIGFIGIGASIDPPAIDLNHALPWYWEVLVLGAGFGLIAFGALDRRPGPAYLGVMNLILFILAGRFGSTLLWWPLILLVAGAFMIGAGLRPRRPLPPEPAPYRAGEAPLAARARDESF